MFVALIAFKELGFKLARTRAGRNLRVPMDKGPLAFVAVAIVLALIGAFWEQLG